MKYKFERGAISKKQIFSLFIFASIFVGGFILLNYFDGYLQEESFQKLLASAGIAAPLIYIVIYVSTLIVAPFTGYPIYIAGIGIFGITQAVILSYIASLVGATTNFYIARWWGRPIIRKLVGKKGVEKIDGLASHFGIEALVLSRLFQTFLFEWISYAAGLTHMKFKTYISVTAVCILPVFVTALILGKLIPDLGTLFVVIAGISYASLPIPFVYFGIKKYLRKRSKEK